MKHAPLVDQLINAFTCLPGVGPRSAQRMAYALLDRGRESGRRLGDALHAAMDGVQHCQRCRNYAEAELCPVCDDPRRDASLVCIVATPGDVLAFEQSGEYRGQYFVLMGELSPLDGVGPEDLNIRDLIGRAAKEKVKEIILATSATVDGKTTAHYITDRLKDCGVKVSELAHGIPVGGELDYLDDGTLSAALKERRST